MHATKMTVEELLTIARREKPHIRYTSNRKGTAIAAWHENRWQTVAMITLTGEWGCVGDLYIDGKPVNDPAEWIDDAE